MNGTHRTGMLVAAGNRADRARAIEVHSIEEAEERDPEHDSGERQPGRRRRRRGDHEPDDGAPGAVIDLEA